MPLNTALEAFSLTLRLFVFSSLLLWNALAAASEHITSRAFYLDVSDVLTFEQLPHNDFQPFNGILSKGYSPNPFWIRLHIDNGSADSSLILRIRPNFLDEVILFDPAYGSIGQTVRGDEHPEHDNYESLNLNFTIPAGVKPRDIWLRVRTNSTLLFSVEALELDAVSKADLFQGAKSGFYLAWIVLFIIWGLLHGWSLQDKVIRTFVVKEILCLIYMLGFLGFFRKLLPEELDWIAAPYLDLSLAPYVAASLYFDYLFLRPYQPNRHLLGVLRYMPAFLPIYLLLWIIGEEQVAFIICMYVAVLAPVIAFAIAYSIPPGSNDNSTSGNDLPRRVLIVVYGAILLGLSISTLPAMGWAQTNFLVFDGFLVYSLISGLAILILLEIRIRQREKHLAFLKAQNHVVTTRFEEEHSRREQQELFVAMLTHELRTPLSVARMSIADSGVSTLSQAEQAIGDMSAILDQCLMTDQLEDDGFNCVTRVFNLRDELQSLVDEKTDPSRIQVVMETECTLHLDLVLFRIIVSNLIDNALRYSEKASEVRMRVEPRKDFCFIIIENLPGRAGWPDSERLFQKYYRSTAALSITGTGLGLYVAKKLSLRLKGDLTYTPTTTHIRFTLCLPL